MNRDLTVGKPSAVLLQFCLPLLGSMLFQQMYNLADSLIVGRFLGENALAAVGNSYEITLVLISIAMGVNMGCSVIVAQLFGAKQHETVKTAIYTTLIGGGVLCAMLMLGAYVFSDALLHWIHTPAELMEDSRIYLDIYILGLPFVFFYNISTGIFSALGDSRTPFCFLAFSSVANVAVDILFVTTFRMGVAGVALATFLCQGISCVLAVSVVLHRIRPIAAGKRPCIFSRQLLRRIAMVAIPTMLQQLLISVSNVVIQGLINSFGAAVMAGYAASIKLNNMVISSMTTMGNGISSFTAQNLGAGKYPRILEGQKAGRRIIWLICIPVVALFLFVPGSLVSLFIDSQSGRAVEEGVRFLRIVCLFYPIISIKLISDGVLRGCGMMNQFMLGTAADMVLRVASAWIFAQFFGSTGIWMGWPASWIAGTFLSVFFVRRRFRVLRFE